MEILRRVFKVMGENGTDGCGVTQFHVIGAFVTVSLAFGMFKAAKRVDSAEEAMEARR